MSHALEQLVTLAQRGAGLAMGSPLPIEPGRALLECIEIAAGEVAYASARIAELQAEQVIGAPRKTLVRKTGEESVQEVRQDPPALHVWIVVRQRAMDRLAAFTAQAFRAGLLGVVVGEGSALAGVRRDLDRLPEDIADSGLAASALVMAGLLDDPRTSPTAKSMCQSRLQDAMDRLRALAPRQRAKDGIDDLADRRAARRAELAAGVPAAEDPPRP